jgi:hypothetical protein
MAPLWSVTRPLMAPVRTAFCALRDLQIARMIKTAHIVMRMGAGIVLLRGRIPDSVVIWDPD